MGIMPYMPVREFYSAVFGSSVSCGCRRVAWAEFGPPGPSFAGGRLSTGVATGRLRSQLAPPAHATRPEPRNSVTENGTRFLWALPLLWAAGCSLMSPADDWPVYPDNPFVIRMSIPGPADDRGSVIAADLNDDRLMDYLVTTATDIPKSFFSLRTACCTWWPGQPDARSGTQDRPYPAAPNAGSTRWWAISAAGVTGTLSCRPPMPEVVAWGRWRLRSRPAGAGGILPASGQQRAA